MRAVVKVGTSSITNALGELDEQAVAKLCDELVAARRAGHSVTLVCSGAIAAGMPALGLSRRPTDIGTLQAIAAVGQPRLMARLSARLGEADVVAGQVLLTLALRWGTQFLPNFGFSWMNDAFAMLSTAGALVGFVFLGAPVAQVFASIFIDRFRDSSAARLANAESSSQNFWSPFHVRSVIRIARSTFDWLISMASLRRSSSVRPSNSSQERDFPHS